MKQKKHKPQIDPEKLSRVQRLGNRRKAGNDIEMKKRKPSAQIISLAAVRKGKRKPKRPAMVSQHEYFNDAYDLFLSRAEAIQALEFEDKILTLAMSEQISAKVMLLVADTLRFIALQNQGSMGPLTA